MKNKLPLKIKRQIDQLANQFELHWKPEKEPDFSLLLPQIEPVFQEHLILALIDVDVELRLEAGQAVEPLSYSRWGTIAIDRAKELIEASPTQVDSESEPLHFSNRDMSLPKQIGRYKLLQQIGEGGMGSVWMAEQQEPVRRRVALKLIRADLGSKEAIARFEAERQALAMMDHQNIAKVLDAGTTADGRPYFVMELVKGTSITEFCDDNQLSVAERLNLFIPVCKAVQHAHQKGIVHRDLKPSNVLVTLYDGQPVAKVIDFGLAKALDHTTQLSDRTMHTEFGKVVGTLQYMSPEQAETDQADIDARTDIYSLGVMLYELLTGSTPLDKATMGRNALLQILKIIREVEPPKPSARLSSTDQESVSGVSKQRKIAPDRLHQILHGELDWVVMKALEKDRSRRYETASGLAEDLQRYLTGQPVVAKPPSATYQVQKFVTRNKGLVASVACMLLLLLAGITATTWFAIAENTQRKLAEKREEEAARETERANKEAKRAREAKVLADKNAAQSERDKIAAQNLAKRTGDSLTIFTDAFKSVSPSAGGASDMLAKDVLYKAKKSLEESKLDDYGRAPLLGSLSESFWGVGEFETAVSLQDKNVQLRRRIQGERHVDTISAMTSLAHYCVHAGQLDRSIELSKEVIEIMESNPNVDAARLFSAKTQLSGGLIRARRVDEAIALAEKIVEFATAEFGREHKYTLSALNNLAAYYGPDKFNEKVKILEETISIRRRLLGRDDPDTLTSMHNLASSYASHGMIDDAISLHQKTLDLRQKRLSKKHPHTWYSMGGLAFCYAQKSQFVKAIKLSEEVLMLCKQNLKADHPQTLESMQNLADIYRRAGRLERAQAMFEEVLHIQKETLKEGHQDILNTLQHLGGVCYFQGKMDEAVKRFEEVVELYELNFGKQSFETLNAQGNLAAMYHSAGNLEPAIHLKEKVVAKHRSQFGLEHPATLRHFSDLSIYLRKANRNDAAIKLVEELLSSTEGTVKGDHPEIIRSKTTLGIALLESDPARAERLLTEVYDFRVDSSPGGWQRYSVQSRLGEAKLNQRKFAAANKDLVDSLEGLKETIQQVLPAKDRLDKLISAVDRLIELSEETDDSEGLKKWQEEKKQIESMFEEDKIK